MQHAFSQSALNLLQVQLIKVVLWGIINPGDCKSREHQGVTPWLVFCVCNCAVCRGGCSERQEMETQLVRERAGLLNTTLEDG